MLITDDRFWHRENGYVFFGLDRHAEERGRFIMAAGVWNERYPEHEGVFQTWQITIGDGVMKKHLEAHPEEAQWFTAELMKRRMRGE